MRVLLLAAAVALVVRVTDAGRAAWCQSCTYVTGGGVVCATTATGKRREFPSLCEMNRINCVDGRQEWSATGTGACAAVDAKAWGAQTYAARPVAARPVAARPVAARPRAQSQCASCAGSVGSAICARNALGRELTFVNSCWLERNNCLTPALAYTYVGGGHCQTSTSQSVASSGFTSPTGDGMAAHPNARLINGADCGRLPVGSKVLYGMDAGLFQFPWAAHLRISEPARGQSFTCGGSVISARYVLTAAHCVSGYPTPISLSLRVGDYVLSSATDCALVGGRLTCAPPAQEVGVEAVAVHPLFNNDTLNGNDLALLRLRQTLSFNTDAVKPVCLPLGLREENRVFAGESMTVIGWGATASGMPADTLQAASVPAVSNAACQQRYGPSVRVLASQLCAGGNARDSCAGDSGAPLMFPVLTGDRLAAYGLVSYGVACGGSNPPPGVYTRVGAHMGWLLDNIRA